MNNSTQISLDVTLLRQNTSNTAAFIVVDRMTSMASNI